MKSKQDILLFNTLSKKKELFVPLKKDMVVMYHCGPTVYWNQHIGNMRAMVVADIVRRTFLYDGYKVDFVRNYTDVGHLTGDNVGDADSGEDRMEKAAKREHLSPDAIADKYIKSFTEDILLLNTLPPTHTPRATEYISEMIDMVQTLLDKGFAYAAPEAIYFDVKKFPDYTKLSGQKLDSTEAGEGSGTVKDTNKHNPHDFALWFFKTGPHANALQTWPSPFSSPLVKNGQGFPGWHIECSVMSKHFLGSTFDIHLGGIEHVPIHHTNEIAQSECANGVKFVDYWLHNEHLLVDGKKMSKSEGTSYLLKDIIDKGFSPLALRYFFLQAQYRSKQNFTWEGIEAAEKTLKKLKNFLATISETGKIDATYKKSFQKFINDDFNVSGALAVIWDLVKDTKVSDEDKKATILDFDKVLGLKLDEIVPDAKISKEVEELVEMRRKARISKDWKKADELRLEIEKHNFEVLDSDTSSILRPK